MSKIIVKSFPQVTKIAVTKVVGPQGIAGPQGEAPALRVVNHTESAVLTAADAGLIHTNAGALGDVFLTLPIPPDPTETALAFTFICMSIAAEFRIKMPEGVYVTLYGLNVPGDTIFCGGGIGDAINIVSVDTAIYVPPYFTPDAWFMASEFEGGDE